MFALGTHLKWANAGLNARKSAENFPDIIKMTSH